MFSSQRKFLSYSLTKLTVLIVGETILNGIDYLSQKSFKGLFLTNRPLIISKAILQIVITI